MDPTSPGEPSRQPPSRRRRVILVRLYLIQAQFALHHLGIPSDQADAREGRRCSPITPKTYRNRSRGTATSAIRRVTYRPGATTLAPIVTSLSRIVVSDQWSTSLGKRSEEHTSELQSLMRISYADFFLEKK